MAQTQDYILQARGLTKRFGGFCAVSNLDLDVRRHSIHALIGPNGAGKSTCFNLLTRFLDPTAGTITFNAQDITKTPPARLARMGVARSFQISAVFPRLTVLQNVRVALQHTLGTQYHFWRSEKSLSVLNDKARALIAEVGLAKREEAVAGALPYGAKRALEIATTLALEPELLLLDEPMAGLGHEDIHVVTEVLRGVARGRTILMVEHNMNVISTLSDTITVLARGEILAQGDYAALSRDPRVIEAYLGAGHV